jgi:hypothetical protein
MTPFVVAAAFAMVLLGVIVAFLVLDLQLGRHARPAGLQAWANIDVALKQRHDELPNLVEAVRDLMAFERRPSSA